MFLHCLQRHITVCAARDLPLVTKRDPGFWNVVSMMEPELPMPMSHGFRQHLKLRFHDVENVDRVEGVVGARWEDLRDVFEFVDGLPGQPILIHCNAGLSRSPAVALGLIVRGLWKGTDLQAQDLVAEAVRRLLAIRSKARPNVLVLRLALGQFLEAEEAEALTRQLVNDPRLLANRFLR